MVPFVLAFLFIVICSAADDCNLCLHQSKVAYFMTDSPLSSGACGYGSLASGFNNGQVAAAAPYLFKDGVGCGACYQIRCKDKALCKSNWTTVAVTDLSHDDRTEFVLSDAALKAMANDGMSGDVLNIGIVDVEYKRTPCDYKNQNMAVRIEESSQRPYYLAITVLYQGGQTEIQDMSVAQVGGWGHQESMKRNYGAVWDTSSVPRGPLKFRFGVTYGYEGADIWANNLVPEDWQPGAVYDLGVQMTDIRDLDGCRSSCNDDNWN